MKLELNDKIFENKKLKEKLIEEFSHKVSMKKVENLSPSKKMDVTQQDDLAFCDLSVIDYTKNDIDKEFKNIAYQEESMLNQTELDIFDILQKNSPMKLVQGAEYLSGNKNKR